MPPNTTQPIPDISGSIALSLVSMREVAALCAFSKTHLYQLMGEGRFPKPVVRFGTRYTRWRRADVEKWLADPAAWVAAHAPQDADSTVLA